jgi:hypothetical protein
LQAPKTSPAAEKATAEKTAAKVNRGGFYVRDSGAVVPGTNWRVAKPFNLKWCRIARIPHEAKIKKRNTLYLDFENSCLMDFKGVNLVRPTRYLDPECAHSG